MTNLFLDLRGFVRKEYAALDQATRALLLQWKMTLPAALRDAFAGDLPVKPYTPLTAGFFGVASPAVLAEAAAASVLMEHYCCLQDARIDGHSHLPVATSESLGNLALCESLARFHAIAGDRVALTPYVHRAFAELAEGYAEESKPAGEQDFFRCVTNRAAPFHILIAALGLHAGRKEQIEPCSRLARHLLFWYQMLDDLQDWRQDLAGGRRSYLLHRLTPLVDAWTERDVSNALYLFGGAEKLLDEGAGHLEAAQAILRSEPNGARALERLIRLLLRHHRQSRRWCIERKRALLATAA